MKIGIFARCTYQNTALRNWALRGTPLATYKQYLWEVKDKVIVRKTTPRINLLDNQIPAKYQRPTQLTYFLFCHSFHAVELLRQGYSPTRAARTALKRIAQYYPTFRGGLITVTKDGRHGMAKIHDVHDFQNVLGSVI